MKTKLGDILIFMRGGLEFKGKVIKNYEQSALIEVLEVSGGEFPFDKTVINHKKGVALVLIMISDL
jgi:hypothetical protein